MSATMNSAPIALPFDLRPTRAGLKWLLVLLALGLFAFALVRGARLPWFDFKTISVEGDLIHNTAASVRRQAQPQLSGGYFTMNLQQARAAFETVPWVRRAQVKRVWPGRLVVTLEEHRPVAFWERTGSDPQLVNDHAELFEVNLGDLEDDDLPMLRGPKGSTEQVLSFWQALSPVVARMPARLVKLSLSDRGSWRAELDTGATLEIGRGEPGELLLRTERFVRSVPQIMDKFDRHAIEYVDLRHSDSYALRLAGVGFVRPTVRGKPE